RADEEQAYHYVDLLAGIQGALRTPLRLVRGLVAGCVRHCASGILHTSAAFKGAAGLHKETAVRLHGNRKYIQRPGRRPGNDDSALLRVSRAVAGTSEPSLAPLKDKVGAPGNGTAQMRALAPKGQQTAGGGFAVGRDARLEVQKEESSLRNDDWVCTLSRHS